jgi:hypothetical protein
MDGRNPIGFAHVTNNLVQLPNSSSSIPSSKFHLEQELLPIPGNDFTLEFKAICDNYREAFREE